MQMKDGSTGSGLSKFWPWDHATVPLRHLGSQVRWSQSQALALSWRQQWLPASLLSCLSRGILPHSSPFQILLFHFPFHPADCCQPDVVAECNRKIPPCFGPIKRPIDFTCLIGRPNGCNATRCPHQLVSHHNEIVLPFYCTSSH